MAYDISLAVNQFFSDGFNDGDVISHLWLEDALQLPTPKSLSDVGSCQWERMARVEDFKRVMLFDHKIYLESVRGEGYRIVPPKDQAFVAVQKAMRVVSKELDACSIALDKTRTNLLSTDESKRHTDAQVRVSAIHGMLTRGKRDVFRLFTAKKNIGRVA